MQTQSLPFGIMKRRFCPQVKSAKLDTLRLVHARSTLMPFIAAFLACCVFAFALTFHCEISGIQSGIKATKHCILAYMQLSPAWLELRKTLCTMKQNMSRVITRWRQCSAVKQLHKINTGTGRRRGSQGGHGMACLEGPPLRSTGHMSEEVGPGVSTQPWQSPERAVSRRAVPSSPARSPSSPTDYPTRDVPLSNLLQQCLRCLRKKKEFTCF